MSSYPQASAPADLPREYVTALSTPERMVMESLEHSVVTLEDYAARLITCAESLPEVTRRELAKRRRALLRDDWGRYLLAMLKNWLTPETFAAAVGKREDQADMTRNVAKRIWSELAVLYKRPPVRRTKKDPRNAEAYAALLKGTDFDGFWQRVELNLEAHNDLLIWPCVVTRNGKQVIKHRLACPDVVTVRTAKDDGTELEAVLLIDTWTDDTGGERVSYIFWTPDWYATFDEERGRTDVGEYPGVNPFGVLPFVVLHREPCEEKFWNPNAGEDLVNLTLLIGRNRTCDHFTRKMSGFTQLMAWGDNVAEIPQQLRHESAILQFEVGANGGVREVKWDANLSERAALVDADIAHAAASRGINPENLKKAAVYQNSTVARLGERGLNERRQSKIGTLQLAESEYYQMVCRVAKANGLAGVPNDDELEVEHAPIEYPEDPLALLQVWQQSVQMALESQVTLIRKLHPSWSEDEAKKWAVDRVAEIAWLQQQKQAAGVPNDITNQSRAAEQAGAMGPPARDGATPPARQPVSPDTMSGDGVGSAPPWK